MRSLQDAWAWYVGTRQLLRLMGRLADRYSDQLPWNGPLGQDEIYLNQEGPAVASTARLSHETLDDLAVLVLFSLFESEVRERVLSEVQSEVASIRHRALREAANDALQQIEEGSFFRVLAPYKQLDHDLVEQVNQVRRYRNWVAHGRRGKAPASVGPQVAFDRLNRFLEALGAEPPLSRPGP